MNNVIDIKRLGRVFRKDFLENGKWYLLLFLTMTGILGIVLIWRSTVLYDDIVEGVYSYGSRPDFNTDLLMVCGLLFLIFGILFASTFMKPMNSKIKRISFLINPSSMPEKYLSRWIIVTIGYTISFLIAFLIVDALRVGVCSVRYPDLQISFIDMGRLVYPGEWPYPGNYVFYNKEFFGVALCIYLFFQSLFILGATFWEKATFIKTFSACVIIMIAFVLICRWTILLFYGDFGSFFNVLNSFESGFAGSNMEEKRLFAFMASVLFICALTNWALAFFRFRESEIIKRL